MGWNRLVQDTVGDCAGVNMNHIGIEASSVAFMTIGEFLAHLCCYSRSQDQPYSIELISLKATVIETVPASNGTLGHSYPDLN